MSRAIDIQLLLEWAFRDQKVETQHCPDEDALTAYWAVMALPEPHATMVRLSARTGTTPEWRAPQDRVVSLGSVRERRVNYTGWVRALTVLRKTLGAALQNHDVYGPSVNEAPWLAARRIAIPLTGRSAERR
jgi:hypothetical protein